VTLRDKSPASGDPAADAPEGLSEAELEAETAQELPDREAMSIVGLPGVLLPPTAPVDVTDVPDPTPSDEPLSKPPVSRV
jgi:hypothetical protein